MRVCLERGRTRVFASALDWPGWARSGKGDEAALDALESYAERYRPVASRAGAPFPARPVLSVVETVPGDATTEFGAPSIPSALEELPLDPADRERRVRLVRAAWDLLDEVAGSAPAGLRKGPRGGGRDRDAIVAHVLEAERAYARKVGVRHPPLRAPGAVDALRTDLAAALLSGSHDGGWPTPYAIRRIAWHVLDHAWEIQDKS